MTLRTLELRDIAEVQRVHECTVAFVTRRALECIAISQVYRMLKYPACRRSGLARGRLVERGVTNGTIVADHTPIGREVLAVVAPETALSIVVPNVIRVCLPIRLHLGEKICSIDPLNFRYRSRN